MVFCNAVFVVSIILIRFSLVEGYTYGAVLALIGVGFGMSTLLVFTFHMKVQARVDEVRVEVDKECGISEGGTGMVCGVGGGRSRAAR